MLQFYLTFLGSVLFFSIVFGAVTEGAEFAFMVLKILQSHYIHITCSEARE